jgi:hypothetical protein
MAHQEYPKWLPTDDGVGVIVWTKEAEDALKPKDEEPKKKPGRPKKVEE